MFVTVLAAAFQEPRKPQKCKEVWISGVAIHVMAALGAGSVPGREVRGVFPYTKRKTLGSQQRTML